MKNNKKNKKIAKKSQKKQVLVKTKKTFFPYFRIFVNIIIIIILIMNIYLVKYIQTEINKSKNKDIFLKYTINIKCGDNKLIDISDKIIDYPLNKKIKTKPCST